MKVARFSHHNKSPGMISSCIEGDVQAVMLIRPDPSCRAGSVLNTQCIWKAKSPGRRVKYYVIEDTTRSEAFIIHQMAPSWSVLSPHVPVRLSSAI